MQQSDFQRLFWVFSNSLSSVLVVFRFHHLTRLPLLWRVTSDSFLHLFQRFNFLWVRKQQGYNSSLGMKFKGALSRNSQTSETLSVHFPTISKVSLNFLKTISFDFIEFSMTKLFNVTLLARQISTLNITKHLIVWLLLIGGFPTIPSMNHGHGLGHLNMMFVFVLMSTCAKKCVNYFFIFTSHFFQQILSFLMEIFGKFCFPSVNLTNFANFEIIHHF